MSIATLSASVQELTPADELIGTLTRERVELVVRYAANMAVEQGCLQIKRWLAYALDAEIPAKEWEQVYLAASDYRLAAEADLEFWFDMPNTEANREKLVESTGTALDFTIRTCAQHISTDLGLQA